MGGTRQGSTFARYCTSPAEAAVHARHDAPTPGASRAREPACGLCCLSVGDWAPLLLVCVLTRPAVAFRFVAVVVTLTDRLFVHTHPCLVRPYTPVPGCHTRTPQVDRDGCPTARKRAHSSTRLVWTYSGPPLRVSRTRQAERLFVCYCSCSCPTAAYEQPPSPTPVVHPETLGERGRLPSLLA